VGWFGIGVGRTVHLVVGVVVVFADVKLSFLS